MGSPEDLVMRTLLEIKEDLGGLSSDVKSVKQSLIKNDADHGVAQDQIRKVEATVAKISGHVQSVKDMEVRLDDRIGKIEADVKIIKEIDVPMIKDQLVIGRWLATKRNKIFALVGVGLLGAFGNAVAGVVKDNVKVSIIKPIDDPTPKVPSVMPLYDTITSTDRDAFDAQP